jgi:hypothetical protein
MQNTLSLGLIGINAKYLLTRPNGINAKYLLTRSNGINAKYLLTGSKRHQCKKQTGGKGKIKFNTQNTGWESRAGKPKYFCQFSHFRNIAEIILKSRLVQGTITLK